jgi:hypothetical protein
LLASIESGDYSINASYASSATGAARPMVVYSTMKMSLPPPSLSSSSVVPESY